MSTVADALKAKGANGKGTDVAVISPDSTALDAARRMNERRIGSLVVVGAADPDRVPLGIITERDILTRLVAAGRDPSTTHVAQIMTERVITCRPATTLDELRHVMREKRIRHVPVIDQGRLAGLVSIGDLNTVEVQVMTETIQYLERYIYRP